MIRPALVPTLLVALTACGTTSYEADVEPAITRSCASAGCHFGTTDNESGLDLSEGNGYDAMVNQPSTQAPMDIVTPGDLENSYLWHKINGTHLEAGGEGDPMPPEAGSLSASDINLIEDWIVSGAAE